MHRAVLFLAAEGLDDVRPDWTRRAQLRDLHKEVRAHGNAEHNLARGFLDRQAALHQSTQILDRNRDDISRVLYVVGAAAAEHIVADHDRAKTRSVLQRPFRRLGHLVIKLLQRSDALALTYELSDRVRADKAFEVRRLLAGRLHRSRNHREHRHSRRAAVNVKRILIELQAIQRHMHIVQRRDACAVVADLLRILRVDVLQRRRVETDIVNGRTFRDLELQQLVVLLRQRLVAGLGDAPRLLNIPADIRAAQIVAHARERIFRQYVLRVLTRIHRFKGDVLVSLREHDLLKRRSLQKRFASHLPFLVRRRRKLVQRYFREVRLALRLLKDCLQVELALGSFLCFFHQNPPLQNRKPNKKICPRKAGRLTG